MTNQQLPEEWRKVRVLEKGKGAYRLGGHLVPLPEEIGDTILRDHELAQKVPLLEQVFGESMDDAFAKYKHWIPWQERTEAAEADATIFRALVERLRQWDMLDVAADGSYWKGVIDAALAAHKAPA